jgi:hypothetical protein
MKGFRVEHSLGRIEMLTSFLFQGLDPSGGEIGKKASRVHGSERGVSRCFRACGEIQLDRIIAMNEKLEQGGLGATKIELNRECRGAHTTVASKVKVLFRRGLCSWLFNALGMDEKQHMVDGIENNLLLGAKGLWERPLSKQSIGRVDETQILCNVE